MPRRKTPPHRRDKRKSGKFSPTETHSWLYGLHTVSALLTNPARHCARVVVCDRDLLAPIIPNIAAKIDADIEIVSSDALSATLPDGAVHQGIAALVAPLAPVFLEEICAQVSQRPRSRVIILDQVTDPHNIGAILRTAAAFETSAVVVQDRHTPPVTGVLAKAASGGLELCPLVRVTNLARAIDSLKQAGAWCIGLDGAAEQTLRTAKVAGPVALVLGAEGAGLRRLTREGCDALARIPHSGALASLNVSNAAAIGLYEISQAAEHRPS